MIWSGVRAVVLWREHMAASRSYVSRLGFTLVALLDAFAIILILHLGAPPWAVLIAAVAIAAAGHRAIESRKNALGAWVSNS
jgi:hypothetical protein